VYGWWIPPKDDLFPQLRGEVPGFGTPPPRRQKQAKDEDDQPSRRADNQTAALDGLWVVSLTWIAHRHPFAVNSNASATVSCISSCI
jgi:hypothetical protein